MKLKYSTRAKKVAGRNKTSMKYKMKEMVSNGYTGGYPNNLSDGYSGGMPNQNNNGYGGTPYKMDNKMGNNRTVGATAPTKS